MKSTKLIRKLYAWLYGNDWIELKVSSTKRNNVRAIQARLDVDRGIELPPGNYKIHGPLYLE